MVDFADVYLATAGGGCAGGGGAGGGGFVEEPADGEEADQGDGDELGDVD